MAKRTRMSIIIEYLLYGYDPDEIAEIEGFNPSTVKAYLVRERNKYTFQKFKDTKNYFERRRLAFSEDEMDYGSAYPIYKLEDLNESEIKLSEQDNHEKLKQL